MDKNLAQIVSPSISDMLDATKRQTSASMNCVQIGTIQSFDPATQLASIKLSMLQVVDVMEDGTKTYAEYPLIQECPVVTLFGGVDFLSMPITAGDNCIVLFNDREIDNWVYFGDGRSATVEKLHDLNNAIALVGIRPLTNSIGNYLANGIRLSHGNGESQMDLKDGLIDTIADLFFHHGNMQVSGNLQVGGNLTVTGNAAGEGGTLTVSSNVTLTGTNTLTAPVVNSGNGATGTFTNSVTVVNGIVTNGS